MLQGGENSLDLVLHHDHYNRGAIDLNSEEGNEALTELAQNGIHSIPDEFTADGVLTVEELFTLFRDTAIIGNNTLARATAIQFLAREGAQDEQIRELALSALLRVTWDYIACLGTLTVSEQGVHESINIEPWMVGLDAMFIENGEAQANTVYIHNILIGAIASLGESFLLEYWQQEYQQEIYDPDLENSFFRLQEERFILSAIGLAGYSDFSDLISARSLRQNGRLTGDLNGAFAGLMLNGSDDAIDLLVHSALINDLPGDQAAQYLARLGDRAVPYILNSLSSDTMDSESAERLVQTLTRISPISLLERLFNESPEYRETILTYLSYRNGDIHAIRFLGSVLHNESMGELRWIAADVLSQIGGDTAIPYFTSFLTFDSEHNEEIIRLLENIRSERSILILIEIAGVNGLDSEWSENCRIAAIQALAHFDDQRSILFVASFARGDYPQNMRIAAIEALAQNGRLEILIETLNNLIDENAPEDIIQHTVNAITLPEDSDIMRLRNGLGYEQSNIPVLEAALNSRHLIVAAAVVDALTDIETLTNGEGAIAIFSSETGCRTIENMEQSGVQWMIDAASRARTLATEYAHIELFQLGVDIW